MRSISRRLLRHTRWLFCLPLGLLSLQIAAEAPQQRVLTEQDLVDILVGSCIQSTRSCDPTGSIADIRQALQQGRQFSLASLDDLPPDWMVVAVQALGGGGAWDYVTDRTTAQKLPTIGEAEANSRVIDLLEAHTGQKVNALVRSEAAGATATALLLAAERGIPVLDAGITGRAVPEVQQSIPWINGMTSVPTAILTQWGDEIVIRKAVDEYRVEDIGRAVAVASGGFAVITMAPMSGEQISRGTIANNITQALTFGRAVRRAREQGHDPVQALLKVSGGYRLFEGVVARSDERGDRGFNWVDVEITGTGDFAGEEYAVFVKNENIVAWRDGVLDAISPDYIYNLNPRTGEALVNEDSIGGYPLDEPVVIVGVPAPAQWRSAKGVQLMGPRHFDFDFDYVPLEILQERRQTR